MSVWSEASGAITMRQGCGYSLRTGLREIYDEVQWQEDRRVGEGRVITTFSAAISLDGLSAARVFDEWVKAIRAADKEAWIDFTVAIRFL